jgi:putative Mn2+ efflux pump MntP
MKAIILLGLLTGLDNLQVTPALGVVPMSHRRRLLWAVMFGLAEALMPLIGLGLGSALHTSFGEWAEYLGPTVLLLSGIAIIVMARRHYDIQAIVLNKWAIVGLPLLLSIDNLLAGVGLGAGGAPVIVSALVIGGFSTIIGLAGLYAGHMIRRWLPGSPELFSGGYLVLLGVSGFFWNSLH